jgi:hypothetical protein
MAMTPNPAAAQDRISVTLGSHHTDDSYEWEEVNPGLFLTWEGKVDLSAGTFLNSFGGPSIAATAYVPVVEWQGGECGGFLGAAWYPGYGEEFLIRAGDVVPMGGIQCRAGNVFAQVMPGKIEPLEAIFAVGLTWSFASQGGQP